MIVYADRTEFAEQLLPAGPWRWSAPGSPPDEGLRPLAERLFDASPLLVLSLPWSGPWQVMFAAAAAARSQYDVLVDLCRDGFRPPHGLVCLAGEGSRFHGLQGRPWVASAGNLHLSVFFAPGRPGADLGAGFPLLAAVSVIDAVDAVPGLERRAGIKWVNDILIEGAKVSGVLAHTQSCGSLVTGAVLGIGLNVEATPPVEPSPFVPRVACLRDFAADPAGCTRRLLLARLLEALDENYGRLVGGGHRRLLDRYRERCVIVGQEVTVCPETAEDLGEITAAGCVRGIGEHLELLLEGLDRPLLGGRLVLGSSDRSRSVRPTGGQARDRE